MFGLSIRSLLMGLFALMALIIGGEGLLAINKISAVNNSVVEIATNWMPSINVIRQINGGADFCEEFFDDVVIPDDAAVRTADREGASPIDHDPQSPALGVLRDLASSLV